MTCAGLLICPTLPTLAALLGTRSAVSPPQRGRGAGPHRDAQGARVAEPPARARRTRRRGADGRAARNRGRLEPERDVAQPAHPAQPAACPDPPRRPPRLL